MPSNDQRLCAVLLVAATLAVALIGGLAAWAAWLGGGAWLRVLAPFTLVLLVPVATLVWLLKADTDADELPDAPAASEQDPVGSGRLPRFGTFGPRPCGTADDPEHDLKRRRKEP